ncbi:MAG: hypothetical protein A3E01_06070 [Gammaproteobacteria bacterium RIFCSPHIGHO2_12_FULL_63_22]|nr:MAG: hypothetical protein A3E01_06070 [Gammaproteobacteria bacterium RIFCSPHIGHO2_12_FULL_63_22]
MTDSEYVEVMDMTIITSTPGVVLQHTVREHEGDSLREQPGSILVQYGARDVLVGGELKRVTGERVMIAIPHVVEIRQKTRIESRVRPSVASLVSRSAAELDVLKQKHKLASN